MKKLLLPLNLITSQLLFADSLSVIVVDEAKNTDSTNISSTIINKKHIENSVTGNGFISSLLETNPNIEVIDESKNSETAGEIKPGKISFHDAPFYQNNVQIDGVSNNSLIDPNLSNAYDYYDVPGNENETFIDLDLIKSIKILDSNISAEYGNFTGGVIDVKTIRPRFKKTFKFSYKHTSDKFTSLHFGEKGEDFKEPSFEKHFWNLNYATPINENTGAIFSFSQKKSYIPSKYFGGYRDEERTNRNFMLKTSHYLDDDSVIDITGTYSPYESFTFKEDVLNSDTTIKGGGYSLKGNYEKSYDFWDLDSSLAYKFSENSRRSANTYKKWINRNSKNWGIPSVNGTDFAKEGGYGNIEKENQGLAYSLKLNSSEYKTKNILHKLRTGLELSYNNSEYNRAENTYVYTTPKSESVNCNGNTEDCVQNDQFFTERRVYEKENIDVGMVSTAAYFENKIKYERFEITPGIRIDYNNYLKNTDLAYRLNSSFKPFNDNSTVIYGGLNRYYGKSFLGYKLREARTPYYDQFRDTQSGGNLGDWGTSSDKDKDKYTFSGLETPFTDEKSIGIRQKFAGMSINLKHVQRNAKNKFTKEYGEYTAFTKPDGLTSYHRPTYFTNDGESKSNRTSLSIGNAKPIDMGTFRFGYKFTTAWTKLISNSSTYDDVLDEENETTDIVYYNGKYVNKSTITDTDRPNTYNMHLNFSFNPITVFNTQCRININNIVKYKSSYIKQSTTGNNATYTETLPNGSTKEHTVSEYEDFKYDDEITLDLKTKFDFKLPSKQSLVFSTEINNVFDEVQNVGDSKNKYKTGRQFWFNIAYRY